MIVQRRALMAGALAVLATPAIVRTPGILMPVRVPTLSLLEKHQGEYRRLTERWVALGMPSRDFYGTDATTPSGNLMTEARLTRYRMTELERVIFAESISDGAVAYAKWEHSHTTTKHRLDANYIKENPHVAAFRNLVGRTSRDDYA